MADYIFSYKIKKYIFVYIIYFKNSNKKCSHKGQINKQAKRLYKNKLTQN